MARRVTDDRRRSHGTKEAVIFVVILSIAAAVFLVLSIPVVWAIVTIAGVAAIAVRMVRDIHGNRAI